MNRASLYATDLDDGFISLLELRNSSGTALIRVTDWDTGIAHGGVGYLPEPFQVVLAAGGDDGMPQATVRVDNASLIFITAIRSITEGMAATLSVVSANDPDTLELGPLVFDVSGATYDARSVELILDQPDLNKAVPHHVFGSAFPGLLRAG